MRLDEEITLLCAFRYALGRRTYVTSSVSNILIERWNEIPKDKRRLIIEEIEEAIKKEEVGSECDKENWKRIIKLEESSK